MNGIEKLFIDCLNELRTRLACKTSLPLLIGNPGTPKLLVLVQSLLFYFNNKKDAFVQSKKISSNIQ